MSPALALLQGGGGSDARKRRGSIVNIASLAAVYGLPFALHYATSKAAVIGMTRALARELGRDWIRVNAVAPSAVMTEAPLNSATNWTRRKMSSPLANRFSET